MKRKVDFLSVFLILTFSVNFIINIGLFIGEEECDNLISAMVSGICLFGYILLLAIGKSQKNYFFVYDDFYLVDGVNIIQQSKLTRCQKTDRYKKYGLNSVVEEKYFFDDEKKKFYFWLVKIDEERKVIAVSNRCVDKYFVSSFKSDRASMIKHYYSHHKIVAYSCDTNACKVVVKNEMNLGVIKETDGKFTVSMYRYCVPVAIPSLKEVCKIRVGWEYDGSQYDDGIDNFDSYKQAEEYILQY